MLDNKAREDFKISRSSVFPWILMASYAYYHEDNPILSDECYDKMCKYALEHYGELSGEHTRRYITEEALRTGSLYHLTQDSYPYWSIRILNQLRKEMK